jgi:CubicO group peptidase (beta-lactamase class C family)
MLAAPRIIRLIAFAVRSGYALLGYLVEKASGESYEKFVQANILGPLGMNDSGYDSNTAIIARRAAGYVPGNNGPQNAALLHTSINYSAGALYSTTEDLLRWEQGLFGGKLLSTTSLAKMTTPFKSDYAFGVYAGTYNGQRMIYHTGGGCTWQQSATCGSEGSSTFLGYYPDNRVVVVVLANLGDSGTVREIRRGLAMLAHSGN